MAEVSSKGFPRCAKCGGSESEHPVIHVEEGAYSACIDVEIAGLVQPSEAALRDFPPEAHAHVVNVAYTDTDPAVVQVGFRPNDPFHFLNIYRHDDGWSLERRASS